jgi:hypothetical protein
MSPVLSITSICIISKVYISKVIISVFIMSTNLIFKTRWQAHGSALWACGKIHTKRGTVHQSTLITEQMEHNQAKNVIQKNFTLLQNFEMCGWDALLIEWKSRHSLARIWNHPRLFISNLIDILFVLFINFLKNSGVLFQRSFLNPRHFLFSPTLISHSLNLLFPASLSLSLFYLL